MPQSFPLQAASRLALLPILTLLDADFLLLPEELDDGSPAGGLNCLFAFHAPLPGDPIATAVTQKINFMRLPPFAAQTCAQCAS